MKRSDCHVLNLLISLSVLVLVAQSWPTLCDPMDCSLPGSSVHGIFQARVLECGAIENKSDNLGKEKNVFQSQTMKA